MASDPAGRRRDRVVQQLDEPAGGRERLDLASADHVLGDPSGELLLAVVAQDSRQLVHRVGVEHVGRGQSLGVIHPHVQWGVLRVGESPLAYVELHRGHPEVEEHGVDLRAAEIDEHFRDLVIDGVHERDPVTESGQPLPRQTKRIRVAVDADELSVWAGSQYGFAVATQSEGGIDVGCARLRQ